MPSYEYTPTAGNRGGALSRGEMVALSLDTDSDVLGLWEGTWIDVLVGVGRKAILLAAIPPHPEDFLPALDCVGGNIRDRDLDRDQQLVILRREVDPADIGFPRQGGGGDHPGR